MARQRTILSEALAALETVTVPGTILEPGYVWRRHRFGEVRDLHAEPATCHACPQSGE